jgi:hypothetical protein
VLKGCADDDDAGSTVTHDSNHLSAEDRIALCLAGKVAEPEDEDVNPHAYMKDIAECLMNVLDEFPEDEREALERAGTDRARALLDAHCPAFDLIANRLIERGNLCEQELVSLFLQTK